MLVARMASSWRLRTMSVWSARLRSVTSRSIPRYPRKTSWASKMGVPLVSSTIRRPSLWMFTFSIRRNGRILPLMGAISSATRRASSTGMKSKGLLPTISWGS